MIGIKSYYDSLMMHLCPLIKVPTSFDSLEILVIGMQSLPLPSAEHEVGITCVFSWMEREEGHITESLTANSKTCVNRNNRGCAPAYTLQKGTCMAENVTLTALMQLAWRCPLWEEVVGRVHGMGSKVILKDIIQYTLGSIYSRKIINHNVNV